MSLTNLCSCARIKDHKMTQNNQRSLPTILKNYVFGIIFFKKKYFDLLFLRVWDLPPLEIDLEVTDVPGCISDIPPHACTSSFYLSGLSQKHGSRESVTRWCVWWIEYFELGAGTI